MQEGSPRRLSFVSTSIGLDRLLDYRREESRMIREKGGDEGAYKRERVPGFRFLESERTYYDL